MLISCAITSFILLTFSYSCNAFHQTLYCNRKNSLKQFSTGERIGSTETGTFFDIDRIRREFPGAYLATETNSPYLRPERRMPEYDAPILIIRDFLSTEECDNIRNLGEDLEKKGVVSDLYLNHRVNNEISSNAASKEALQLIQEQNLDEEELAADSRSGYRSPLPSSALLNNKESPENGTPVYPPQGSVGQKILRLLDCQHRKIAFVEELWRNPTPDYVMIRDQTTVHYRPGEGVPPHVDGNHATLLVYLSDVEEGAGGRTIFPEAGIASTPKKGSALLYCSRGQRLLHFAESVKKGEKWVMQVLIDHLYRKGSSSNYMY